MDLEKYIYLHDSAYFNLETQADSIFTKSVLLCPLPATC